MLSRCFQDYIDILQNLTHQSFSSQDEHPYREFNTMQLNRVQLLDKILLVCKQMYLYDNNQEDLHSLLTPSCCQVIVEVSVNTAELQVNPADLRVNPAEVRVNPADLGVHTSC